MELNKIILGFMFFFITSTVHAGAELYLTFDDNHGSDRKITYQMIGHVGDLPKRDSGKLYSGNPFVPGQYFIEGQDNQDYRMFFQPLYDGVPEQSQLFEVNIDRNGAFSFYNLSRTFCSFRLTDDLPLQYRIFNGYVCEH